jgi:hypothetical protein
MRRDILDVEALHTGLDAATPGCDGTSMLAPRIGQQERRRAGLQMRR